MSGEEWQNRLQANEIIIAYFPGILPCSFAWKIARFHAQINRRFFVGSWNDDTKEAWVDAIDHHVVARAVTSSPYRLGETVRYGSEIVTISQIYEYIVPALEFSEPIFRCGGNTGYKAYIYQLSNGSTVLYSFLSALLPGCVPATNVRVQFWSTTENRGLEGSTIRVVNADSTEQYSGVADATGTVTFPSICDGSYHIYMNTEYFGVFPLHTGTLKRFDLALPVPAPSPIGQPGPKGDRGDAGPPGPPGPPGEIDYGQVDQRIDEKVGSAFAGFWQALETWLVERIIGIIIRALDREVEKRG